MGFNPHRLPKCEVLVGPPALAFFKEQGAKGGRIGGRRSLQTMTSDQRAARTKKASKAAAAARRAKRAKIKMAKG
jgi:hypothetical protein